MFDSLEKVVNEMSAEELEFVKHLPTGQWLFVKLEAKIQQSSLIQGLDFESPFASVIAVGPEFRADVKPGDRVTYAERLNLPKELKQACKWANKYAWIHENKFLGRLPRNSEETRMPEPKKAAQETKEIEAGQAFLARVKSLMQAEGLDLETGKPLPKDS